MKKRVGPASNCVVNDTPHFHPISFIISLVFVSFMEFSRVHILTLKTRRNTDYRFFVSFLSFHRPPPHVSIPFVHALTFGARRSFPTAAATNLLPVKICIILNKIEKNSDKKVFCLRSRNFDKRGIKERNPFFVRFIAGS